MEVKRKSKAEEGAGAEGPGREASASRAVQRVRAAHRVVTRNSLKGASVRPLHLNFLIEISAVIESARSATLGVTSATTLSASA